MGMRKKTCLHSSVGHFLSSIHTKSFVIGDGLGVFGGEDEGSIPLCHEERGLPIGIRYLL